MELAEIRRVTYDDIPHCVTVIRESFATVAAEFGITPEFYVAEPGDGAKILEKK